MTLLSKSKSNSMIAKYNGDKLDIVAENDDGHSKNIKHNLILNNEHAFLC